MKINNRISGKVTTLVTETGEENGERNGLMMITGSKYCTHINQVIIISSRSDLNAVRVHKYGEEGGGLCSMIFDI